MAPPLFASWALGFQALGSKFEWFWQKMGRKLSEDLFFCSSPDSGRKMGQNLSEDHFFFALHLILSEKWKEIWVRQFQILIYVPLKFSEVSGPLPLFKILRTLLRWTIRRLTISQLWLSTWKCIALSFWTCIYCSANLFIVLLFCNNWLLSLFYYMVPCNSCLHFLLPFTLGSKKDMCGCAT